MGRFFNILGWLAIGFGIACVLAGGVLPSVFSGTLSAPEEDDAQPFGSFNNGLPEFIPDISSVPES